MMKPAFREPVHLAKLRKKTKFEEIVPAREEQRASGIEYDLQIFQESLNIHKGSKDSGPSREKSQSEEMLNWKQDVGITTNTFFKEKPAWNNDVKQNFNRTHNHPFEQAIAPKILISSVSSNYSSIHKTKTCFKPNTSQIQNKENIISQLSSQNPPKNRTISNICTLKSDVLKQIKMLNQSQAMRTNKRSVEEAGSTPKEAYERRIKQLQLKNQQNERKVVMLQMKLKEKEEIASRVDQIQNDLNVLIEQNKGLQRMNQSLSKLSLHSEENRTLDMQIQTDIFPLYVCDSFCQTIPSQRDFAEHRQSQFNALIEGGMGRREQIERLQRQLQALSINYEHKCEKVRDKDSLISQYLFKTL